MKSFLQTVGLTVVIVALFAMAMYFAYTWHSAVHHVMDLKQITREAEIAVELLEGAGE